MIKSNNNDIINKIRLEHADSYDEMKWLTPEAADAATCKREKLIHSIFDAHKSVPGWQFSNTKLFSHAISPGCSLCGQGDWSCLFINGICNAKCFYCPSSQTEKSQPMTGSIHFNTPQDYADYVRIFNIKGVSFSGGEPFMTFDRVLSYLKTLRAKISYPLYIWMYTNGILITEEKLKVLRDFGLDEIRFDLSATHYDLTALKKAVGIIPKVTVEIPAIPEDLEKTKPLLRQLFETGVSYLNLHQLRCTPFNRDRLIRRGYTFLHGPKVTVLETELAALELILYSLTQKIALPINYCAFTYRHQFQRAGTHRRTSLKIKASHEDTTRTGHIRTLSINGSPADIHAVHETLLAQNADPTLWQVTKTGDQLFFNARLWPLIDFSGVRLKVSYAATTLKTSVSFRHPFKEVALNKKKKVVIERHTEQPGIWLEQTQIHSFGMRFILTGIAPENIEALPQDLPEGILPFESFVPGLAPYF